MVSTFITPIISRAGDLGVSRFEETDPVKLCPNASEAEVEIVIKAVYRQVLGNAYVMESERLSIPESKLKNGAISVREFVRQVAKSDLYRSRFLENCPRYRVIELNFKHLLGRAPDSYEEMQFHSHILDTSGFEAEIDSYLDSDEYQTAFGQTIVPFYRGYKTQTGKSMVGFGRLFKMMRGASSSDKNLVVGNYSRLSNSVLSNRPEAVTDPSSIYSYGGQTNINQLFSTVLAPKPARQQASTPSSATTATPSSFDPTTQRQCEEQAQQISALEEKVSQLRSVANIGASQLNKWTNYARGSATTVDAASTKTGQLDSASLQQKSEAQKQRIKALEREIAQLQSLAAVGEARLNKWRSKTFF